MNTKPCKGACRYRSAASHFPQIALSERLLSKLGKLVKLAENLVDEKLANHYYVWFCRPVHVHCLRHLQCQQDGRAIATVNVSYSYTSDGTHNT